MRFPPSAEPVRVAVVRVALRDVTEAGGPAPTIAEVGLPDVLVPQTGLELPFTLDVDVAVDEPRRTYALRAHADRSGSGSVDVGDLVTTTTATVDLAATEPSVTLELTPVE